MAEKVPEPYPIDYWALRAVINDVRVSPNGKYLALLKIRNKTGNPVLEVYDTSNLDKPVTSMDADPMEITGIYWASDKDVVFTLRQKVRDIIDGFNQGVYENRIAILDVEKKKTRQLKEENSFIENVLVSKPGKIIISFSEGDRDGPAAKLDAVFRPRAYWEFDLDKGSKRLLIRGKLALGNINFNSKGQPWLARGFDLRKGDFIWYWREPGGKGWDEMFRLSEDSFENFQVIGIDHTLPNHILVYANNGHDKIGIWSYDVSAKKFDELIYRRNDSDNLTVAYHSNSWMHPDEVTAVGYFKGKPYFEFIDETEGAIYQQLMKAIPYAHVLGVASRSREGNTMVVSNFGPRDPGTYYLLHEGRLESVGSRQPLLDSENLADVEYITYDARDGQPIHAFLTVPHGKGPFPLIVLPHGGPFVAENVTYDEWGQILANNGYMVVQPQYRGSFGYGLEFHKSSFMNGGQGGHMMQDDKDDAALYLVKRGLVDPDRIAMFGWSYGGYAALVAASRTPQIHQCVIAGAAVADQLQQVNYYRYLLRGAQEKTQMAYREGSVNPIDEVAKVNVPILLIHGDVDQRVPITHSDRYRKELNKHGKNYKYLQLDGADHFSSTLFYHHQKALYETLLDYLKNDCGPGGL